MFKRIILIHFLYLLIILQNLEILLNQEIIVLFIHQAKMFHTLILHRQFIVMLLCIVHTIQIEKMLTFYINLNNHLFRHLHNRIPYMLHTDHLYKQALLHHFNNLIMFVSIIRKLYFVFPCIIVKTYYEFI